MFMHQFLKVSKEPVNTFSDAQFVSFLVCILFCSALLKKPMATRLHY